MRRILIFTAIAAVLLTSALGEGSLSQINQSLEADDGWVQLVYDSPWSLGESTPYEGDSSVSIRSYGTYPSIDGSTVSVPLGRELARQLLGLDEEDLNGFVAFSTTSSAYERLILSEANTDAMIPSENAVMDQTHPVDLILVTEPSDEELALAKKNGVELEIVPFCWDAFVFLVNAENPVTGLTTDQIRRIYTGDIVSWDEVGGASAAIIAYQRAKNSGSQTGMENMVMKGLRLAAAEENYVTDGMSELVQHVGDYDNGRYAIGYSYLYYVTNLYRDDGIRLLSVDGAAPTEENIRSGAYPYAVHYYAVYRKGDEQAAAFAQWLVSEDGQACVEQAGYIPLN